MRQAPKRIVRVVGPWQTPREGERERLPKREIEALSEALNEWEVLGAQRQAVQGERGCRDAGERGAMPEVAPSARSARARSCVAPDEVNERLQ